MPRTSGISVDKNFIAGRISQATGLNFPENACLDELNCVFNENGSITRRNGFDNEIDYSLKTISRQERAVSSFLWRNASGDGNVDIVVVQVGPTLYYYLANQGGSLSSGAISDTTNLATYTATGAAAPDANECQYSSGLGYLFVTHPLCEPFAVVYDVGTNTVSEIEIIIKVRDLEGAVEDTETVTSRPGTLDVDHSYNLLNQGWDEDKIVDWYGAVTVFPSNADVWWLYRDAVDDTFDPTVEGSFNRGNTPAPRGHFIIDVFEQDRDAVSGLSGVDDQDTDGNRPQTSAFFAGRVFYACTNFLNYDSRIFFSQTIETSAEFGKCYSNNDPTSETLFDVTPTDGGYINIPEAGTIFKLFAYGNYLLVFASNGVWAITGSTGIGFTTLDYTVLPISSVRTISATNFVNFEGTPVWWNTEGIYVVSAQDNQLKVESLTDKKIKDDFLEISYLSKVQARGAYNPFTKVIQWLYRSEPDSSITNIYDYDRILNFNTLTGAFYTWEIAADSEVDIHSILTLDTGGSRTVITNQVTSASHANNVQDALGNNVVTFGLGALIALRTPTKYLISYVDSGSTKFTFAECNSENGYMDWNTKTPGGLEYDSYFVTGYKLPTQGVQKFQDNYLYVFSDSELDGRYNVQALWNFANTGDFGTWSSRQNQVIVSDNRVDYHRAKIKLRGHGHALSLKFSSVDDNGFNIVGWSTWQTANQGG